MAIYIGTEEEEWKKVLENHYLMDLVLHAYGNEPIAEYGSYWEIPKELRKQILTWLRKQDGYYEMLLVDTEEEEKQDNKDTVLPQFDELEERISHLEYVLKHLKAKKERKEKERKEEMKKRKKNKGHAEGSGSNF
ncbi:hypothetical protein CTI12_AA324740 [Artemisia annua]|uniref:Uncharacterized protein n=1 Tax=Artemisia annua TaxID=35608 RepID=A0A2U1MZL4_ARTAN|nr:hypothetical protein CTI12_AA324740 [Artemisia annua]